MSVSAELGVQAPEDIVRARTRTAFVAAAYGDALGWPNESRGKSSLKKPRTKPSPHPVYWQRRTGGATMSHAEQIAAGTYSDDTQLIISLSRSYLRAGDLWWRWFTGTELPFWRLYQRGGGGATMRAAKAWSEGKAPWESVPDQYFAAGGNGVAMRVLPHVVRHLYSGDFSVIRDAVILDGIATHGHPRALLGASAFAFALWFLMRRRDTLRFGQLVDDVSSNVSLWSGFPPDAQTLLEKHGGNTWKAPARYRDLWNDTVAEVQNLLSIARAALEEGAVLNDRPTLEKLGGIGQQRGSGTISAVAAMFLTSRYVTDPSQGVMEAAFAAGADTDTLASMTGTLLACVGEGEQLAFRAKEVQDHDFLVSLATDLFDSRRTQPSREAPQSITNSDITRWQKTLWTCKPGSDVELLDRRTGLITSVERRRERNISITEVTVTATDGQTLQFKRLQKSAEKQPNMFDTASTGIQRVKSATQPASEALHSHGSYAFGTELVLRCRDLERTVRFYESLLGLRVYEDKRPKQNQVRIEGSFTFASSDNASAIQAQSALELRLRVRGIEDMVLVLLNAGFDVEPYPRDAGAAPAVSLRDPDGRTVILLGLR